MKGRFKMNFEIGDKVRIKNAIEDKIFVVSEVSQDREGNPMVTEMYNWEDEDDVSDLSWYPEELELYEDEPRKDINDDKCKYPIFKSYGLTKEQVLEVVMLFITNQIGLHKGLAEEAFHDNNYEWAADYLKDVQALLHIKMMEDKLYHRFVQE